MHRTEGPRVDATPEPMIRLEGVGKRYDDGTVAVQELDLDVPEGELDEVAEAVVLRRGALENPRPVTAAEVAELLRSVW